MPENEIGGLKLKAVILATGYGRRLLPFTQKNPKSLIKILDKSLLEHIITALKQSRVEDIVIVTGYLGQAIRSRFSDGRYLNMRIQYIHNHLFKYGNGVSLKVVKNLDRSIEEPFLLLMADHLISADIVGEALKNLQRQPLLCVDRKPLLNQSKKATKVLVQHGYVRNIGKKIKSWNYLDTGVFILNKSIFETIKDLKTYPLTLSRCLKEFIKRERLWACDVSGEFWVDIDTWADLELARNYLLGEMLICHETGTV